MEIEISPETWALVEQMVRDGTFESPKHVIDAAVHSLRMQIDFGDFEPGELDALIAEGQKDFDEGRVYDGEEVFRELKRKSQEFRHRQGK